MGGLVEGVPEDEPVELVARAGLDTARRDLGSGDVVAAGFAADETGLDRDDLLARASAIQVRLQPVAVEVETTGAPR